LFRCKDPLDYFITLTSKCWFNHILKEHPIMGQFLSMVKNTIRNPDYIYQSKIDSNCHLHFNRTSHTKYGSFFILVVIEKKEDKLKGYVKTSFPVFNLKKGGLLIWKK